MSYTDKDVNQILLEALFSPNERTPMGDANIVDGLFAIAVAIQNLATQVKYLGNGDAATTMGALEAHGKRIGEALEGLANAVLEQSQ